MTFIRYFETTETGTIETITCEDVPPYTIIKIFGDELPFNMLRNVYDTYNDNGDGFHLEVKKIQITGSEEQLIVASIGNIQMLEKKYSIHHSCDMFHFLHELELEEEQEEDEEDEEDEEKPICCFCSAECLYTGNNPYPLAENGVCCDGCNEAVIFARMGMAKLARSMLDKRIAEKVEKLVSDL